MYSPQGYAEFRTIAGRKNGKVDLFLTGNLNRSIQTGKRGKKSVLGFDPVLYHETEYIHFNRYGNSF